MIQIFLQMTQQKTLKKLHHEAVTKYKERVYEDYMTNPENTHGHVYVKPPDEENSFEDQ